MGQRYSAILRHLGYPVHGYDVGNCNEGLAPGWTDYRRAIVATPTAQHRRYVEDAAASGVSHVLVEKPVCAEASETARLCETVAKSACDVRVVCNWSFVLPGLVLGPGGHTIRYANWSTGPHGPTWDCCQLRFLAGHNASNLTVKEGPVFVCTVNGLPVSLADIDRSYVTMVAAWLANPTSLWSLQDGLRMEKMVEGTALDAIARPLLQPSTTKEEST